MLLSLLLSKIKHGKYAFWAVFIVFLLSALRYDIGNDYASQYRSWNATAELFSSGFTIKDIFILKAKEPVGMLLCYLFRWTEHPAAWVFFTYSTVFYLFFFLALKEENCITTGIFILFTLLYLFYSWDWTRQGVAYVIGLFSFRYIKKEQIIKFICCVFFAMTFHLSAFFLFLLYPLRSLHISKKVAVAIILFFLILACFGLFRNLPSVINNIVGQYIYTNYLGANHSYQVGELSVLLLMFKSLLAVIIIYYLPKEQNVIINCITIGTIIYVLASGNLLLERMSCYLTIFQVFAYKNVLKANRPLFILLSILLIFYFNYSIYFVGGTRGAVPYDSVFSSNFEQEIFRYRQYLAK